MIKNSLVQDYVKPCVRLHKITVDDGYGGETTQWVEGAHIDIAFSFDSSTEARVAQAQGVNNRYTLTVDKTVSLQYHDVFRRLSDGKVFRVTSDGTENETPDRSPLGMKQAEAEEWVLPNG